MAPPPPPPPPPPPICLPFFGSKKQPKRLPYEDREPTESGYDTPRSSVARLDRSNSYSPTATVTSQAEKVTFSSDSESYNVAGYGNEALEIRPVLKRSATVKEKGTAKALPPINEKSGSKKWFDGYGWGSGNKNKEKEREREREAAALSRSNTQTTRPPLYESPRPSRRP